MTKVSLRKKPMTKGRQSLYLDFYPAIKHPETGKQTRRQFLGLYVFDKPGNQPDKDHNKAIIGLAQHIRAQRQVQIAKEDYSFLVAEKTTHDFYDYARRYIKRYEGSTLEIYRVTIKYLEAYTKKDQLPIELVDEKFCDGFREFLLKTNALKRKNIKLSQNSAAILFKSFKSIIRQAYRDDITTFNASEKVRQIKTTEVHREYLTLEELQLLAATECERPMLKNAALFSALTGLRYSDIEKLTWDEVRYSEAEGHYIQFRQKKTKSIETLPISDQAYGLLGERDKPEERIFVGLKYSSQQNRTLHYWVLFAGIKKKVFFHSFRHTFATLQLSLGTDIYTVSKMLGHKDLSTTQIYAKIIDKSKREAANRIKLEL
ncbi:site-specific integrase [Cytophagaceae bacterium YF14B1]|uniref:Site-specific integrase n=1 Tax=Xanthocytophaga flava TaxID=3048013 RepID=A0AAE3QML2_9BACT|nr:site-specific integrase [Xanthocytophaga flavus]MDJ1481755.1 site-specific integrase [Xanthocytophaga flavus]